MLSKRPNTAYASYVFSNVLQFARVGQGMYSYDELARGVGLKPTHNFRRRINELVSDGSLVLCPAFTSRGGIENRFMAKPTNEITEIPF